MNDQPSVSAFGALRSVAAAACIFLGACAHNVATAPSIDLAGPSIVRDAAEPGPQTEVAAYVRLRNTANVADRLTGVSCACAQEGQIHAVVDGAMQVLPALAIPAHGELEIAPGGPTHLMLMGVHAPIAPGEHVSLELRFARSSPLVLDFEAVGNSREAWAARAQPR